MSFQLSDVILPGESIGTCSSLDVGVGTYLDGEDIKACLAGRVVLEPSTVSRKSRANVLSFSSKSASEIVIDVGDTVLARVTRINMNQASVEILSVRDSALNQYPKGIIRREDVRLSEIDKLVMHECFRPGDVVRAHVLSLGDARQYFLSTSDKNDGVVWARSQSSGEVLVAVSWKEMEDPQTKIKEPRKVAKP
eukprot:gene40710-53860_t